MQQGWMKPNIRFVCNRQRRAISNRLTKTHLSFMLLWSGIIERTRLQQWRNHMDTSPHFLRKLWQPLQTISSHSLARGWIEPFFNINVCNLAEWYNLNNMISLYVFPPLKKSKVFYLTLGIRGCLPGSNGYGSKFFKHAWDTVQPGFVVAVQEFFRTEKMLRRWNHTVIALVPKSMYASRVSDYQPISCCTVF